jgi:hypothetical protein
MAYLELLNFACLRLGRISFFHTVFRYVRSANWANPKVSSLAAPLEIRSFAVSFVTVGPSRNSILVIVRNIFYTAAHVSPARHTRLQPTMEDSKNWLALVEINALCSTARPRLSGQHPLPSALGLLTIDTANPPEHKWRVMCSYPEPLGSKICRATYYGAVFPQTALQRHRHCRYTILMLPGALPWPSTQ